MVLFKHGVGYFVREGQLSGQTASLVFRADEINDVLKSLTVLDRAGGRVLGIDYQTPMDVQQRWANTSIRLSADASLRTLLTDLRGRLVTLQFGTTERTGRLVGLDLVEADPDDQQAPRSTVSLRTEAGQVLVGALDDISGVRIEDEQATADLDYSLDTVVSDGSRRVVNIRLSDGDHDLVAHYVAPSPVWRVSYRVVAEDLDGADPKALVQAWGLFDNRLEEDLTDVELRLVAGQPISFVYDLYASQIPQRPQVGEEHREAVGPITFEAAMAPAPGGPPMMARAKADMAVGSLAAMDQSFTPVVEGREAGEFFEYVIGTPVSVARGDSALVPILSEQTSCRHELLYSGEKHPANPVAALRMRNTTGLTLERGPATLIRDGSYSGDAIVPFTPPGAELYLPYAIELGIKVTEQHQSRNEAYGLRFDGDYLLVQEYVINQVSYQIVNSTPHAKKVTIEAPRAHGADLYKTPAPTEETPTHRRWEVSVPAHATAKFEQAERFATTRAERVLGLDHRQLQRFFSQHLLDQDSLAKLSGLLDLVARRDQAKADLGSLDEDRKHLLESQEQFRVNLGALQNTPDEQPLRARMLAGLTGAQDQLDALSARRTELQQEVDNTSAAIDRALQELGKS